MEMFQSRKPTKAAKFVREQHDYNRAHDKDATALSRVAEKPGRSEHNAATARCHGTVAGILLFAEGRYGLMRQCGQ
jgi:hypothetical protein